MFRSADLVLVNKMDLLEHLDFDLEQFLGNLDAVNPGVERVLTSARTGRAWTSGAPGWSDAGLPRRRGPGALGPRAARGAPRGGSAWPP